MAVTHLRDEQIRSCVRDALGGETLALRSAQAQGVQFSTPPLDAQTNEPQADEGRDLRLRRWRRREDLLACRVQRLLRAKKERLCRSGSDTS